jgi:formate dehydrogenase maturation protein FdhE
MCAACGTRDQSRLVTLSLHQGDVFWVEACDACGRYLKTVDQRRLVADQAWVLRAADAASLHLDLLADDAGYERLDRSRNSLIEMTS